MQRQRLALTDSIAALPIKVLILAMITLNDEEKAITAKIVEQVFGAAIAPDTIQGLTQGIGTVIVVTNCCLHSLGKDFFKSLVQKFKAETEKMPPTLKKTSKPSRHKTTKYYKTQKSA